MCRVVVKFGDMGPGEGGWVVEVVVGRGMVPGDFWGTVVDVGAVVVAGGAVASVEVATVGEVTGVDTVVAAAARDEAGVMVASESVRFAVDGLAATIAAAVTGGSDIGLF